MSVDELRRKIVAEFSQLWQYNDAAHGFEHFLNVELCAMDINEKLQLGHDPKLILLTAFFHDLFVWSRHNHHEMSSLWIRTAKHSVLDDLTPIEREVVADACMEHRASFRGQFSREFSELINAADREQPDVHKIVHRAMACNRGNCSRDEHVRLSVAHVKDKYGTGGYARYPELYLRAYGEELEDMRRQVDALRCGTED